MGGLPLTFPKVAFQCLAAPSLSAGPLLRRCRCRSGQAALDWTLTSTHAHARTHTPHALSHTTYLRLPRNIFHPRPACPRSTLFHVFPPPTPNSHLSLSQLPTSCPLPPDDLIASPAARDTYTQRAWASSSYPPLGARQGKTQRRDDLKDGRIDHRRKSDPREKDRPAREDRHSRCERPPLTSHEHLLRNRTHLIELQPPPFPPQSNRTALLPLHPPAQYT